MAKKLLVALKCSVWNDENRKIHITRSDVELWHEQFSLEIDSSFILDKCNEKCTLSHDENQFNMTCEGLHNFLKFKILESTSEEIKANQNIHDSKSPPEIKIEVYDNQSSSFVSLLRDDVRNQEVEERFGKRIQCVAFLEEGSDWKQEDDPANPIPAIMGRYFPIDPDEGIDFDGGKLLLKELNNNKINGTGLNIWDGALLMVKYLELCPQKVHSKRVLELGSGCGPAGIAAGILGAKHVVLTDLPYTLDIMECNVNENIKRITESGCNVIECKACDWFSPPHVSTFNFIQKDQDNIYPDVILIADCVWLEELVDPLFQTINKYLSTCPSSNTEVIITYQRRGNATHERFMSNLRMTFGFLKDISICEYGCHCPDNLFIFSCKK